MMRSNKGFTLIELMVVVAIVAILASIAYPSYIENIRKSRRADAQSTLQTFAAAMERYYTLKGSYAGSDADQTVPATNTVKLPHASVFVNRNPSTGVKYYDLKLKIAVSGNDFILYAVATGEQAGDGDLSLSSNGERKWDKKGDASWSSTW